MTKTPDNHKESVRITRPTKDPCEVYPEVPGINCRDFQLSPEGLTSEQRRRALDCLQNYQLEQQRTFLGYQVNQRMDYQDLKQYLNVHINNVGDPYESGNLTVNSKFMERAVLDYFAALWNGSWPHQGNLQLSFEERGESLWGYVLSMGSTEGNINGLWNGRDYLAGKFLFDDPEVEHAAKKASSEGRPSPVRRRLMYYQAETLEEDPNAYTPVAFYSQDTHYSIVKAMRVLHIQTFNQMGSGVFECPLNFPDDYPEGFSLHYLDANGWPHDVPSNEDGSIHLASLAKLVEFFADKGHPILASFNYGTTFKGAYDNVKGAVELLVPILKRHGLYERDVHYDPKDPAKIDRRNGFWFHVDGALGASYMPFIEMALKQGKIQKPGPDWEFPVFDFRLPEIHSLAMSGHKWLGAPWPCGIYMTKVKYQLLPPDDPEYIGSPDTTFAGSRNGFSPMIFWDFLARHSFEDLVDMAVETENVAAYAVQQLEELEKELETDLWIERSPLALTIRFREANPHIIFKYSLSGETLYVHDEKRTYNHIFIMGHVTRDLIDELIGDLRRPGAFSEQEVDAGPPPEYHVTENAKRLVQVPHYGRGFK